MKACTSGWSQDGSGQKFLTVGSVTLISKLFRMQKRVMHCSCKSLTKCGSCISQSGCMACCFTQRLKIAKAPHQEASDCRAIAEDSHQCHQPALQRLAPARHGPAASSTPPPDCSDRHFAQSPPAVSFQLHINLQI